MREILNNANNANSSQKWNKKGALDINNKKRMMKGLDFELNLFYNKAEGNAEITLANGSKKTTDKIGMEYDLVAKYAYTEDVSIWAAAGLFDLDSDNVYFGTNSDDITLLKWGVAVKF